MAALPDADLPDLKQMTVGGEACPAERAAYWSRGRRFFNGYGPTETAICATLATGWEPTQNPPIGRPIANDRAYVLDARLQPTPIGVAGELYIGGVGVTRGYVNRPDVTATSFLPDPYSNEPGARMYRTGDRVRWLRDGQLDFLGRADGQVKIRGFRVELGEIETVLRQHGTLKDCHVMARESTPGQKRLVAYVVAEHDPPPTASELRDFVKSKLPDYMTPSAFVFMESLPRHVNGKINWRALPAPAASRADLHRELMPPRNATEEVVAGIWCELLQVSDVSVHDDFFELGGHSLLATQVVSRLRSTLEVEVPLRAFFKDPTVAGLADNVERIRRTAQGIPAPPLVKVVRDGHLPTSFAQQRLWFFDQMEPGNLFYNLPNAIRLHGNLDEAALRRALTEIIRRHESLRTTFVKRDSEACQVIAAPSDVTLAVIDISDLPEAQREERTRDLATNDARTSFDLAHGPLFRVTLVRLAPTEHVLLATMHHIITDGWSMGGVFFRELAALYRAFAVGEPSPLPELSIQYADFAAWQRGWLQGEVLEQQLGYWREKLADTPPLELPTDRPRLAEPQFRGNFQSMVLSAEFAAQLQQLSRKEGVTLFMTLLAGFQALLSRYSGQDDIAVGTPVAGRNRAEIESLIGFFVNTLVMRTDLAGDPTFKHFLGRVRETCLGAYDHQDIPFEKLVEELHPQRDLSRSPLFQVMFVLQNAPRSSMSLGDLTISRQEADRNITSRYDLTLSVTESERGLGVVVKYKRDLFDDGTMHRFLKYFQTLLEDIVANPERRLSELTLLNAEERQQVVIDWNQTAAEYPRERCVHDLVEERARERPDAIAAIFSGQSLTYAELDWRANQLAHHLQGLGVGLENVVALNMDRSLDVVVAILGVQKTGAAYLPLDPAQPAERTEFILQDAGVRFLLTHSPVIGQTNSARVISIDRDWGIIERHPVTAPRRHSGPDNLAYVIYTSGSTGKPKGVLVPHRGLMNVVTAQNRAFEISPESRVLQWVPINFDASQGEIFRALTAGATLCLAPSSDLMPGEPLRHTMRSLRITAATTHPSAPSAIADANLPDLRSLSVGGDQCPIDLAMRWATGRKLFNGYGPTETTICATLATGWDPERTPPIGRPISNTQVYVLDTHMRPAPVGVPGELYIGGDGVARGYLRLPELTAVSFVPDPFGDRPGARLYRTGDRVRWLVDGQLEFMGRVDAQVKIRGFRIELGEIEQVLKQLPSVRECAVAAREDTPGDKRLVGYVVTSGESVPATEALRSFLKAKLPEYMVPAAFVFLDAIPRKAHGKVDRNKLPAPDPVHRAEPIPPRDALELQLVQIWEEVLSQRPIGVRDNFFELGGHSLLAVKLMDRMKSAFDKKLSMAVLFRHPTIEDLADKLRQQSESDSPLVEIRPQGNQWPLYLIHPAEGNVLCYANLVGHLDSDLPIYGLQARGLTGEQEPHATLEEMATEYLALIRAMQPHGPYRLGGWSTGGLVAYEMAQQLSRQGEPVELVAMFDTHVPKPDRQRPDIDPGKRMQEFAKERGFELPAEFATIAASEQLNVFLEHARAANALPPGLGEEQIQRLQRRSSRVFQANMDAVQKYVPQPCTAPLLFVQASEKPDADTSDEDWKQLVPTVTVHQVPGSHESMIKEPNVKAVAVVLMARMHANSKRV
jgi:amino acid adenylation domain-containing protein